MFRALFLIALGGTISLALLTAIDGNKFGPWATWLTAITVVLVILGVAQRFIRRSRETAGAVKQAESQGRIVAAIILDRKQTGMFVNEQPQVEFRLLVDRHGQRPFITTARKIVSLLDVHMISPGSLVTVAHPDPQFGDVIFLDAPAPRPSQWLTMGAADTAEELPLAKDRKSKGALFSRVLLPLVLILVGFVGLPFVASPNAHNYVQSAFESSSDGSSGTTAKGSILADDNLSRAIEALTEEMGHSEIYSLAARNRGIEAEVPVEPGQGTATDTVEVDLDGVVSRKPALIQAREDDTTFKAEEVDWDAVLAAIPEATELARELAWSDELKFQIIRVQRNDFTNLNEIVVDMAFETERDSVYIELNADGEIKPSSLMQAVPEAEREVFLFVADRAQEATDELVKFTDATQVTRMLNYGDHLSMDVHLPQSNGRNMEMQATYRDGEVSDVTPEKRSTLDDENAFSTDLVDWDAIFEAVPTAQQEMGEVVDGTLELRYIIVTTSLTSTEADGPTAMIYLRNESEDGGYVEIDMSGNILRVSA